MIKTFKSDVYPIQFIICVGKSIEEICEGTHGWFGLKKKFLSEELEELRDSAAFAYEKGGVIIISVPAGDSFRVRGVIAHEICHATFFACDRLGIDYATCPQEAFCYLNDWITKKVYQLIEKDEAFRKAKTA